jgi:hypothetical protein
MGCAGGVVENIAVTAKHSSGCDAAVNDAPIRDATKIQHIGFYIFTIGRACTMWSAAPSQTHSMSTGIVNTTHALKPKYEQCDGHHCWIFSIGNSNSNPVTSRMLLSGFVELD